ncbi:MAG: hypothetical protein ACRENK_12560 [Gemmatimonadaceae bacterium]
MHNARFRLMATMAGATMCAFAVVANGQTPTTTGSTNNPSTTGTTGATTNGEYNASPSTPAGTDQTGGTQPGAVTGTNGTPTTGTTTTTDNSVTTPVDNTVPDNTTGSRGFPWGILGLLGLVGLFRGRSTEVRSDVYATTTPGARTTAVGTGTAYDDRTATPRAASGPGTSGTSGTGGTMGDQGPRR